MTIKEKLRLKNSDSSKFVFNILAGQQGLFFRMTSKIRITANQFLAFYQLP
jgi:hypothetical protein